MIDPVLDTLLLPLLDGAVTWPSDGPALFLRARTGAALNDVPRNAIICEQGFKPAHDALVRAGFTVRDTDDGKRFGLTLVLPQRHRDENRALLARAITLADEGGIVMAAAANQEGAKTFESDLKALLGSVDSLSKNKCRVFWGRVDPARIDTALRDTWLAADAPRDIDFYMSRPGLFSWDRIDPGSKLLAENLPASLSGRAADFGAGFGYLSREALARCPGLKHIDLYEAEARAVDMARLNVGEKTSVHWADVTKGAAGGVGGDYDVIISNPPFHTDRADRNELGQAFIRAAAGALRSGGSFYMVANRHLPYEDTLKAAFKSVSVVTENTAFKVFRAVGPASKASIAKASSARAKP